MNITKRDMRRQSTNMRQQLKRDYGLSGYALEVAYGLLLRNYLPAEAARIGRESERIREAAP